MKKHFMLILLLFMLIIDALAQHSINVHIVSEQQENLSGVTVRLLKNQLIVQTASSSANGKVNFTNLSIGEYVLESSLIGFTSSTTAIQIDSKSQTDTIKIVLPVEIKQLNTIEVRSTRRNFEVLQDRTVLTIDNSPSAAGSTALDILNRSPNVSVNRLNNSISLNGKQGVIVYINGKRQRMDDQALLNYLEGLSATNIKKIEFIHTPPSSFDAEGSAGVINIITQTNKRIGTSGNMNIYLGYGQRSKYGISGNIVTNKNKFTLFADASINQNSTRQSTTLSALSNKQGDSTFLNAFSNRPATIMQYNFRGGMDYELSPKTNLGLLVSGYRNVWKLNAMADSETGIVNQSFTRSILKSDELNRWNHGMINLHVGHKIDSLSSIAMDVDYLYYHDWNPTDYLDRVYDADNILTQTSAFRSRKETPIHFIVSKLDYIKKWKGDIQTEIGLKSTVSRFQNDVTVSRLNGSTWDKDDRFSNNLFLNERINAGYMSIEKTSKNNIVMKAGIRIEDAQSYLRNELGDELLNRKKISLFPTVSFAKTLDQGKMLQFSYTMRITRPQFNALAPAFFFFSPTNVLAGNPGLLPTTTKQLTSAYQIKDLALTLQYTNNKNAFQSVPSYKEEFLIQRTENLKQQQLLMSSANYSLRKGVWSTRTTISFFLQKIKAVDGEAVFKRQDAYFTMNTNHTISLLKNMQAEWNGQLTSRKNYGLGYIPVVFTMNAGVQKTWNHHKLSANVTDIANLGSFWKVNFNQPSLNLLYDFCFDLEGNVFRLTYTYQFGNKAEKSSKTRNTAAEEELRRVN